MSCPPAVNVYISGCGIVVDIPNPYITNQQFTNASNNINYSYKDSLTLNSTLGQLPQINNTPTTPHTQDQTRLREITKNLLAHPEATAVPQIDHTVLENYLQKDGALPQEDICRLQDWCIAAIARLPAKELTGLLSDEQNANIKTRSKAPSQAILYALNTPHKNYSPQAHDELALVPINIQIDGTCVNRHYNQG
jgi:hypothetical protein